MMNDAHVPVYTITFYCNFLFLVLWSTDKFSLIDNVMMTPLVSDDTRPPKKHNIDNKKKTTHN